MLGEQPPLGETQVKVFSTMLILCVELLKTSSDERIKMNMVFYHGKMV